MDILELENKAYKRWEELNAKYFDNKLTCRLIRQGIVAPGTHKSMYEGEYNLITLSKWLFTQIDNKVIFDNYLIHEMMHQYVYQIDKYRKSDKHHISQEWCNLVNRLIPLLNIDTELRAEPIKKKSVKEKGKRVKRVNREIVPSGCMTRLQLSQFPYCFNRKQNT